MTYCSTYLVNITLIKTNFISQSQVATRTRHAARRTESSKSAKTPGPGPGPGGPVVLQRPEARWQRDFKGSEDEQSIKSWIFFLIFVQNVCMFHNIENVRNWQLCKQKSRGTKDSDRLEILSGAVKWKECDENWKTNNLSVNMPTKKKVHMTVWLRTYDLYLILRMFLATKKWIRVLLNLQ